MACPACNGTGRAQASVLTVRMGLSPWEKFWSFFRFPVDRNPKPHRKRNGSYRMLAKYVELKSNLLDNPIRVSEWGETYESDGRWVVPVVLYKEVGEQPIYYAGEFVVHNREVVGFRRTPFTHKKWQFIYKP